MASNVQFFGAESVKQAFELRALNMWAIFQGRDLVTAGEGSENLCAWLDRLQNSTAVYKLKVYSDVADPEDIDEGTVANGSFNFKLENPGRAMSVAGSQAQPMGVAGIIQRKIEEKIGAAIDRQLSKINFDGDDIEEEEPTDLKSIAIGMLKTPEKIPQLIDGVKAVLAMAGFYGAQPNNTPQYAPLPPQPAYSQPAAIAGVLSQEEKYTRIGNAIDKLELQDPDIVTHLEKLADISIKNPVMFKSLLSMLQNF